MMIQLALLIALLLSLVGCAPTSSSSGTTVPQYTYVLSRGDGLINQYNIATDGSLTAMATPTIPTGLNPTAMIMDSSKTHLYVANGSDDTISQYLIGSDGALSVLATPIATGCAPSALVMSPGGTFLYALNVCDATVSQYTVAPTGALSLNQTIATGNGPSGMTFDPSGSYAYIVNSYDETISQFSLASDGGLAPLSPASIAAASCPTGPILSAKSSNGSSHVYTVSCSSSSVEMFDIAANGTLTSNSTVATGLSPQGMTIANGALYTANAFDSSISMFTIQSDGRLVSKSTATVAAGLSPETLAVNATKNVAYVIDYSEDKVLTFSVSADGTLSERPATVSTSATPTQILVR